VLEPTDEMVEAYNEASWNNPQASHGAEFPNVSEGLAAVLAIVERDNQVTPRCAEELVPGLRCTRVVVGGPHRGEHEGKTSTGNKVQWAVD
jgi:hypothetical protein